MTLPSDQYLDWLRSAALPFWRNQGWDPKQGGWFERLGADGKPDQFADRRTRVQSRQIVALCQAAQLGWDADTNLDLALKTLEWWWAKSWAVDGMPGFCHRLDKDCLLTDPRRDAYDHAFAILGLSWAYRLTGDAQIRAMLGQVHGFLNEHMVHPNGGFVEYTTPQARGAGRTALEPWLASRRQNPHMHMVEAMVAARIALGKHQDASQAFDADALMCLGLFDEHFHDRDHGVVIEHFDANWLPLAEPQARRVEPGHGTEWVWLLHDAHKVAPDTFASASMEALVKLNDVALAQGFDDKTGLLANWFDPATKTASKAARSWPTMEMIRAGIALGLETQVERGFETLIQQFNLPQESRAAGSELSLWGGWRDSVIIAPDTSNSGDSDKETLAGGASSMQTSTLYHVMGLAMAMNPAID